MDTRTAIVNFRTLPNGAYRYMRGLRRGFWRVLLVNDPNGCTSVQSHNVRDVIYEGPDGIDGVTERSSYCIEGSHRRAIEIAAEWNAKNHTDAAEAA